MKEILVLIIISGLALFTFCITLIIGVLKKNRKLKMFSFFIFLIFGVLLAWTGYKFLSKSYNRVSNTLKPRTGNEIYDALFDKRQYDCVKIINYQDQVVPKIDYAIWLQFETCPQELKRILLRHPFTKEKAAANSLEARIPYGEKLGWFNPKLIGDTLIVYEYSTNNSRSIQTLWVSPDSTKVFCRDVLD